MEHRTHQIYLASSCDSHMNEEEKFKTVNYIDLRDEDKILHQLICDVLRKPESVGNDTA